ncbi:PIN domain-containing protein [Nocardioides sp. LHD-245]|uniref:type II toxin-antitoxin system VapC family toxin n=1 Tax=Nocardioides sp. LHD-245 TaxID=3051387 RepID=UPI0027DEE985|nr:PIN domain-containing protein [Nocardioides sp. LHD-245]
MTALHLDTHVVVWLYAGEHARFPDPVRERLAADPLRISPIVRLELTYLHEIGRITVPAARIVDELERAIGLEEDVTPFGAVTRAAEALSWTRDPFDRLIAAQALVSFATLATKDDVLREGLGQYAVWS